jgi:hypothetical protein
VIHLSLSLLLFSAAPAQRTALQTLQEHCLMYAADPKNPWALAHGIKLFGPSYLASDGRKATEVVVHDFLLQNVAPDGGRGEGSPYGFIRYAKDGTPIEPHANLNTKALVCEGKMSLKTVFKTSWGQVTLGQLVDSIKQGFRHTPTNIEYWKDVGWTLDLLAQTQKPKTMLTNFDGKPIAIETVFDDAMNELERSTDDLKKAMKAQLPQLDKRKQGLYAHSCGGMHFVQGVVSFARNPEVKKKWAARLNEQIDIHFYRLESEQRQYEAAFQQSVNAAPQLTSKVLVQMIKFHGHFLETVSRFRSDLKWKPNEAQKRTINRAKATIEWATKELETRGVLTSMETLKKNDVQLYLDLIGDSCHAAHGLKDWP